MSESLINRTSILAIEVYEQGIVLAIRQDQDIHFKRIQDENLIEIGLWENIEYEVPGSCTLIINDNRLACSVVSEESIFSMDLEAKNY